MRYRALIAYDGGDFHGWQIQSEVRTVEGVLTEALAQIAGTPSKVQGASRTDAGVHAFGQVAHFDYAGRMTAEQLRRGLNALAPADVRVFRCEPVSDDFHARHDARGKRYRYDLWVDRFHHPLFRRTSTLVRYQLRLDHMAQAAAHLIGTHDFSAFRASTCDAPSPVLCLSRVTVLGEAPRVRVVVEGAAFLKYMVRTIVGTLVEVGRGRRHPDSLPELLASGDRSQAGPTARPQGLHLVHVRYPDYPWTTGEIAPSTAPQDATGS